MEMWNRRRGPTQLSLVLLGQCVNKKTEKHLTRLEENYMKFMMCKIIHKHT